MKNKRIWLTGLVVSMIVTVAATSPVRLAAQCGGDCPPFTPPSGPNLLANPDFEIVGPCGGFTWWFQNQGNCGTNSAADVWQTHSSNQGALLRTTSVASTLPIGGQARMLRIIAGGNEGGVFQSVPLGPVKVMASVWVFVRRGHVVLGTDFATVGRYSWNTKVGEWELLRVCTDGSFSVDGFFVYNEDPAGGDFVIDRAELKAIN